MNSPTSAVLDVSQIIPALRRRRKLLCIAAFGGLFLAICYLAVATPRYTATANVLIDSHKNQLLEGQEVHVDPQLDAGLVDSQTEILQSEEVLKRAIKRLNLTEDPEFNGGRKGIVGNILALLPSFGPRTKPVDKEQAAVKTLLTNLSVKRIGASYVLGVSYTSPSPATAANVANAITASYASGETAARYDATKDAAKWLESRIGDLKQQATASDEAVQSFKAKNGIVDTSRGLMSEQQLADLNTQLLQAQTNSEEAKARLDQIDLVLGKHAVPDASVADALHNDVINRLRAQYLDLSNRQTDLASRYGANHGVVLALRSQMQQIKKSILDEMNRIAESYKSDYAVAAARTNSIKSSLDALVLRVGRDSQTRVKLRDLESAAQAYRTLYDSYLQKFSQATQQETVPVNEARVITRATQPVSPSSPKVYLTAVGGFVAGLVAALGFIFYDELSKNTFKTVEDVQSATGIRCLGILPEIRQNNSNQKSNCDASPVQADSLITKCDDKNSFILNAPFSRFAETLRNAKVSVDFEARSKEMKTIGVISSLPEEGKSTVASNFAHLLATSGYQTLLIDADLRNPGLTSQASSGTGLGIIGLLSGTVEFSRCIEILAPNLDFLPCRSSEKISNAAEYLASRQMADLLREAGTKYDFLVIDFAPVNPVVDVKAAGHIVDGFLYVTLWDKTSREAMLAAIESAPEVRPKIIGVMLNRANPRDLGMYERTLGDKYHNYYVEI